MRKVTRFQTCERHGWLDGEQRRRRAEFFVEGGPANGPAGCAGGICRLWPGTDIFEPSVCGEEMPLEWTTADLELEEDGRRAHVEAMRGRMRRDEQNHRQGVASRELAQLSMDVAL